MYKCKGHIYIPTHVHVLDLAMVTSSSESLAISSSASLVTLSLGFFFDWTTCVHVRTITLQYVSKHINKFGNRCYGDGALYHDNDGILVMPIQLIQAYTHLIGSQSRSFLPFAAVIFLKKEGHFFSCIFSLHSTENTNQNNIQMHVHVHEWTSRLWVSKELKTETGRDEFPRGFAHAHNTPSIAWKIENLTPLFPLTIGSPSLSWGSPFLHNNNGWSSERDKQRGYRTRRHDSKFRNNMGKLRKASFIIHVLYYYPN